MANFKNFTSHVGRLTRDPEYVEQHGLIKFSIAVDNAGRKDGAQASGFFDVTAWTKPSDYAPKAFGERLVASLKDGSLAKGVLVEVQGRLNHDQFQTKDGQNASRINIVADSVTLLIPRNRDADGNVQPRAASAGGEGDSPTPAATSGNDEYTVHEPF